MDGVSAMLVQYLPTVVMLIVGFALVVVEMYIPGFGVPGIAGILLLIGGVIFARPTPLQALIMVVIIVALLCIALSLCMHSASKGRLANSRFVLRDVATKAETPETSDLGYFVGREGVTHTVLRPAGMAEFDGVKLNVVSDGEYISAGCRIVVDRVEGNRIVVRALPE
jgi:membrane-bound ClpP family serine protease